MVHSRASKNPAHKPSKNNGTKPRKKNEAEKAEPAPVIGHVRKQGRKSATNRRGDGHAEVFGHVRKSDAESLLEGARFVEVDRQWLRPSPQNMDFYGPVLPRSAETLALAASIARAGVLAPLLADSEGWIISGHRRWGAAGLAGVERLPVIVVDWCGRDHPERFTRALLESNCYRHKTAVEKLRELAVSGAADADAAYRRLRESREAEFRLRALPQELAIDHVDAGETRTRRPIAATEGEFLAAVFDVLKDLQEHLPISLRQLHYRLLNRKPLRNSRRRTRYANDQKSYKHLSDLLTRARFAGTVPMAALDDNTRASIQWRSDRTVDGYISRRLLQEFGSDYRRDLLQTQPAHVELVGEKDSVRATLERMAYHYRLPLTINRGYASIPPRAAMVARYRASGKARMTVLVAADFDAEGQDIPRDLAAGFRDDFDLAHVQVLKVALTAGQVERFNLPPNTDADAKRGSRKAGFVARHGRAVYELEALSPEQLQGLVVDAIEATIDMERFRVEVEAERAEALELEKVRHKIRTAILEGER